MSTDATLRLGLPFLAAGQAQKELTHNEALALADASICAAVQGIAIDVPPANPALGQCWIVGATPSGAWAGRAHALGHRTSRGAHGAIQQRHRDGALQVVDARLA